MSVGLRQRIATVYTSIRARSSHKRNFIKKTKKQKRSSSKCLGVEIDKFLTWDSHITSVSKKV